MAMKFQFRGSDDGGYMEKPERGREERSDVYSKPYFYVLPVLFLEFLAISITKSLVPYMLVDAFADYTYAVVGMMETAKGLLAFFSCPVFGRLSDQTGRKACLLFTVVGTTFPVCILAFTQNMNLFVIALSFSGIFSATFPLTFAYIADCVDRKSRAPAYGLALATFGLSFSLGPLTGSYVSESYGPIAVFWCSLLLVVINVLYILLVLPETAPAVLAANNSNNAGFCFPTFEELTSSTYIRRRVRQGMDYLPNTWNLSDTFRIFSSDPFMKNLALIVFVYYTSLWAIVSTLMVYVTQHLHFDRVTLGWLFSCYGLSTMFSEGVLVRIIVPWLGERNSMKVGLLAFACQCTVVAFSKEPTMIFISVLFSMFANLVYPSVSSMVSKIVEEDMQGEALGALNGIKAVTEGFGPLVFGLLMGLYEHHPLPGGPYLLASVLALWAFLHCYQLPPEPELLSAKHFAKSVGDDEGEGLLSSAESSP
jgi:DHA1 family tetracycline resistance protein-like MFS transporter